MDGMTMDDIKDTAAKSAPQSSQTVNNITKNMSQNWRSFAYALHKNYKII